MVAARVDVFVSYAHADDEAPIGIERGWVTTLVGELRKVLRRLLGGSGAEPWMDYRLAAGEDVTDELITKARATRTLLLVMSPGYLGSDWCQLELGTFLASRVAANGAKNVFIIETDQVDRDTWHPDLRSLKTIRFWDKRFDDRAPRLLGFPVPKPDEDSPYWQRLNELAHAIAEGLKAGDAPGAPKSAVWIAEPTEDLLEERDAVASTMTQQGFKVLPRGGYPRQSRDAYLEAVREDQGRAVMLVQLLGPREGRRPTWAEESFVALQAAAASAAHRERGVRFLQWRTREVDLAKATSPRYRELLEGVQASGLEEFKSEILRELRASGAATVQPSAAASRNPERAASVPYVYVNADAVDQDLARRIQLSLVGLRVDAVIAPAPVPGQTPEQIRMAQKEQLESCDGVIFVYGSTPPSWVQSQFAFSRRIVGQRRSGIWGALLDGPPLEKADLGPMSPSLLLVNCRSGLDPAALSGFVERLRAQSSCSSSAR